MKMKKYLLLFGLVAGNACFASEDPATGAGISASTVQNLLTFAKTHAASALALKSVFTGGNGASTTSAVQPESEATREFSTDPFAEIDTADCVGAAKLLVERERLKQLKDVRHRKEYFNQDDLLRVRQEAVNRVADHMIRLAVAMPLMGLFGGGLSAGQKESLRILSENVKRDATNLVLATNRLIAHNRELKETLRVTQADLDGVRSLTQRRALEKIEAMEAQNRKFQRMLQVMNDYVSERDFKVTRLECEVAKKTTEVVRVVEERSSLKPFLMGAATVGAAWAGKTIWDRVTKGLTSQEILEEMKKFIKFKAIAQQAANVANGQ